MKLKNTAILSLSLIYSMNAFSITETITEQPIISLENDYFDNNDFNSTSLYSHPIENKITRPIFDEFASDIYIYHHTDFRDSGNSSPKKSVEVIKITDEIISRMNEEIKKTIPTENIDIEKILITDNTLNNKALNLDDTGPVFKKAVLDYLSNFSNDKDIASISPNERISFNKNKINEITNSHIEIQRHYQPNSKLNELGENIEKGMKIPPHSKEIIFKLENNFAKKITDIEKKQEEHNEERSRDDEFLNEKIHHTMTKLDSHINEINDNNKDTIDSKNNINKNRLKISTIENVSNINTNNITTNKNDINTNKNNINENKENININKDSVADIKGIIKQNKKHMDEFEGNITHLKKEYLTELNINGIGEKNIKDHVGNLYAENTIIRSNINTLDSEFKHFKSETQNRFYKVEKRANQGIASVAAMSNLPFTDSATFSTAIGIGNYRNATALAWGMQYRINENIKVRASTAWNESNWVSAGGVGVSW